MYKLLTIIMGKGKGKRILEKMDKSLYDEAFILEGTGSSSGGVLYLLELYDIKKDILCIIARDENVDRIYSCLVEEYKIGRENKGIAFDIDIKSSKDGFTLKDSKEGKFKYDAIFTKVQQGQSDKVILAAERVGSLGATVISEEETKHESINPILDLIVEPKSETVLVISPNNKTDVIVESIKEDFDFADSKKAKLFVKGVNRVEGLRS
ncbi:hypothetical protein [Lagierella sp.]|uniref:hypothetical protein n=1 Tax=Lagierella sp. TaxID=2849657 RepID=UPI002609663C|nr:hypothetical protein [Lagierella sp.]